MVAGEKHVWHFHAPVLGRPGELRKSAGRVRATAEAILGQRLLITYDTRYEPGDGVDEDHRRDLSPTQHVIANRYLVVGEALANPVVDAS